MTKLEDILNTEEGQYRYDIFRKLSFDFKPNKKILDVGCGSAYNSRIFRDVYNLQVTALDVYKHNNIDEFGLDFVQGSITNLPFDNESFDYVFAQDVLHHIDEKHQARDVHIKALLELSRVVRPDGFIILIEANRYNPLFFPHMVKWLGHNHFKHEYYLDIVNQVFKNASTRLYEIHYYNSRVLHFWRFYEKIMESTMPDRFLAYNISVIRGDSKR